MLKLVESGEIYSSRELAEMLGITTATLRKYNFFLSKAGITFQKEKGKLVYSSEDVSLFRKLMKLHARTGTTLEQCVAELAEEMGVVTEQPQPVTEVTNTVTSTVTESAKLEELESKLTTQFQEQMKEMREYIDTKLNERDEKLTTVMRDMQQVKQEQEQQRQRGLSAWFKRLFGAKK